MKKPVMKNLRILAVAAIFLQAIFISCSKNVTQYSVTSALDQIDALINQNQYKEAEKELGKLEKNAFGAWTSIGIFLRYSRMSLLEKAEKIISMVLAGLENRIKASQFDKEGNVSFGIREHIDIPGMRYNPDIGIFGMNVSVTFEKPGYRIAKRKIRQKKVPQKHRISKEETMKFMEENFKVNYVTE